MTSAFAYSGETLKFWPSVRNSDFIFFVPKGTVRDIGFPLFAILYLRCVKKGIFVSLSSAINDDGGDNGSTMKKMMMMMIAL